jgi:integrase/recombinase XerC
MESAPLAKIEQTNTLDGWVVLPNTPRRRKRGLRSGRRTEAMAQPLVEWVEQFCTYQLKQKGKTEGGVQAYRWDLEQFLVFVRKREGRVARVGDLQTETIQGWMDGMAAADLAVSTIRVRQSALSSLCSWLVKRGVLNANPVASLDRPPHRKGPPRQVPGPEIMDRLVRAARERKRPRDLAMLLILRYTGMRRGSVARLCVRNLYAEWGLRGVAVKGGKTRDIPLPAVVMQFLHEYVKNVVELENGPVTPDTPLFWSSWGRRHQGKVRRPMTDKNIWRLCKVYGRLIGYPMLKPHDLRHGVAMEVYRHHHDLEQVRGLLGHARIETTQIYAQIQPEQLKQSVNFYEGRALEALTT